ncbi:MAG: hypothetical protein Q4Q58_06090 [Thermoplasmata archaeon]|nr:hypothetical protein [Thermoplasmata archaeon]
MDRDAAIVCYIAGLALIAAGILLTQWTHSIRLIVWPFACGVFALIRGYDHHRNDEGPPEGERSGNAAMYLSFLPGAGLVYVGRTLPGIGLLAVLAAYVASLLAVDAGDSSGVFHFLCVIYTVGYLFAISLISTRHEVRVRKLCLDRMQWTSIRDYRMLCLILTFMMMFLGAVFWIAALAMGDLPMTAAMLLVSVIPASVCWMRRDSIPVYTDDGNPDGSSDPMVFRSVRC